jgi:hypothetical protein
MFNVTKRLRQAAVISVLALVATVVPSSSFSPASAAPVSATGVNVTRSYDSSTGAFTVYIGESLNIYNRFSIDMSSVNTGDVLTFAESIGDVTAISLSWSHGSGYGNGGTANTFTVPSPKPSSISLTATKTFGASANGTKRYLSDITTSGTSVTFADEYTVVSVDTVVSGSGYIAKAGDNTLSYNQNVCVDMTLVAPGDDIELTSTLTPSASSSFSAFTDWMAGSSLLNAVGPQSNLQRTIPNPEPTSLKASFQRTFSGLTTGQSYVLSSDIKKGATSVTLASCPSTGPGPQGPSLYPLGGASVSGNLTLNSVLTATHSSWSETDGGAAITPSALTYRWYVCNASESNSFDMNHSQNIPACFSGLASRVLADGSSVGTSGSSYGSATLTLNQALMTALNGKYLAVMVNATGTGGIFGNLLLPTCGAIGTASTCSVAFGTAPPVVAPAAPAAPTLAPQAAPAAVPAAVKAKKKLTIPAKSAAGLPVKVTASGGCKVKPVVKTVKTKVGKKTVKSKVTTGYTVTMGKKGTSCTITQSNTGDATYDALNSVSTVTAS